MKFYEFCNSWHFNASQQSKNLQNLINIATRPKPKPKPSPKYKISKSRKMQLFTPNPGNVHPHISPAKLELHEISLITLEEVASGAGSTQNLGNSSIH